MRLWTITRMRQSEADKFNSEEYPEGRDWDEVAGNDKEEASR